MGWKQKKGMYCRASYTVGSHFSFPPPRSLVKQPPREKPSSFEGHFASRLILAWNRPFCTLGIRGFFCVRRLPRNASSVTGRRHGCKRLTDQKPRMKSAWHPGWPLLSVVIDFTMLPAKRFWRETVSLLEVMWPRDNQWERALLAKEFQLYDKTT